MLTVLLVRCSEAHRLDDGLCSMMSGVEDEKIEIVGSKLIGWELESSRYIFTHLSCARAGMTQIWV